MRARIATAVVLAFLTIRCSDRDTDTAPRLGAASLRASNTGVAGIPASAPDASLPSSSAAVAYSIALPANTECTITPTNTPNDANHRDVVSVDADGKIRFYVLPQQAQEWGAQLTFTCTGPGAGIYPVNINDPTTYQLESGAALYPRKLGVRPALSGSLAEIDPTVLSAGHYPLRPDPTLNPQLYAQWVTSVTRPETEYAPVPVHYIGLPRAGQYEGSWTAPFSQNPWSGFVQAEGGFTFTNGGTVPYALLYNSTTYIAYMAQMLAPLNLGCGPGNPSHCATNYMWAGVGGFQVYLGNGQYESGVDISLLQSGFAAVVGAGPTYQTQIFEEFAPNSPKIWTPLPMNGWDTFFIEGWAGDSSCDLVVGQPYQGCFYYEDETKYQQDGVYWFVWDQQPYPTGYAWLPATVEFVNEKAGAGWNIGYYSDEVYGESLDSNGQYHADPSGSTDPYIVVTETDQGYPCSLVQWNNQTTTTPSDPMWFITDTTPYCGSNNQ